MIDLKRCPFCGGQPAYAEFQEVLDEYGNDLEGIGIHCEKCGVGYEYYFDKEIALVGKIEYLQERKDLKRKWNRRMLR